MRIVEFPGAPASEGEKHASVNASSNNIRGFETSYGSGNNPEGAV
jgi:hypothetical protein